MLFNWFRSIRNIYRPFVRTAILTSGGMKAMETDLRSQRPMKEDLKSCEILVLPMEYFSFRVIDIPSGNHDVIEGQINRFFPVGSNETLWAAIPVETQTLLILMAKEKYEAILGTLDKKNRSNALIIPSVTAALLYHTWNEVGHTRFAVPVESDFLVCSMQKNKLFSVEILDAEDLDDDVFCYDNEYMLFAGAALYRLVPHDFQFHFNQKKKLSKIGLRSGMGLGLLCLCLLFSGYVFYSRQITYSEALSDTISKARKDTRIVEEIIEKNEKIAKTAKLLEGINQKYTSPYLVLNDFTAKLPEHTFIIDFFFDSANGYISGVTKDVTNLLSIISDRPYIKLAEFSSPVIQDQEGNKRFQISFEIKENE